MDLVVWGTGGRVARLDFVWPGGFTEKADASLELASSSGWDLVPGRLLLLCCLPFYTQRGISRSRLLSGFKEVVTEEAKW